MRTGLVLFCLFVVSFCAFGQAGTGTITGTVSDPAGSVISAATVEAKNTETGVVYPAATTGTGNYSISQLPVGTYEVSVKMPGFKAYSHTNLAIGAAVVLREDVILRRLRFSEPAAPTLPITSPSTNWIIFPSSASGLLARARPVSVIPLRSCS